MPSNDRGAQAGQMVMENEFTVRSWEKYLPGIIGTVMLAVVIITLPDAIYAPYPVWAIFMVIFVVVIGSGFLIAWSIFRWSGKAPRRVIMDREGVTFEFPDDSIYRRWQDLGTVFTSVNDNKLFSPAPSFGYRIYVWDVKASIRLDVDSDIAEMMLQYLFGDGCPSSCPNLRILGRERHVAGNPDEQRLYWTAYAVLMSVVLIPILFLIVVLDGYLGLAVVLVLPVMAALYLLAARKHDTRGKKPISFDEEGIHVFLTRNDRRRGLRPFIPYQEVDHIRVLWEVWLHTGTNGPERMRSYVLLVLKDGKQLSLGAREVELIPWLIAAISF